MQQQPQQTFNLVNLTGTDIEAIMSTLNEAPSKVGRATMNKIEGQVVAQVQAMQQQQQTPPDQKGGEQKPE